MATKKTTASKKPAGKKPAKPRTIKVVEESADGKIVDVAPSEKAKSAERSGHAPRSQLDLDETKKLEAARAKKSRTKKEPTEKRLSALDAAAKVLAEAGEPLNTKQMIEAMSAKGYWTSPGGKTPHATLYSAILREINTKGKEARFSKVERGQFSSNA